MRCSRLLSFGVLAVVLLTSPAAVAVPVQAAGESATGEKDARSKALQQARITALSAAIEQVQHAVDPKAVEAVMKQVELWTSSYRVLERREVDGKLQVEAEFEIDLPRLSKRLAVHEAPPRRGYDLADVQAEAPCPASLGAEASLHEALLLAGVPLFEGGSPLSLRFECTSLGRVPATFVYGARVVLGAELPNASGTRKEAIAFGATPEDAMRAARDQALARAANQLEEASSGRVTLRVHGVGDGARVRRLIQALREGVGGVQAVRIKAVEAGGVVQLELEVSATPEQLSTRIEALSFPDFAFALLPPPPNPQGPEAKAELGAALVIDLEFL